MTAFIFTLAIERRSHIFFTPRLPKAATAPPRWGFRRQLIPSVLKCEVSPFPKDRL